MNIFLKYGIRIALLAACFGLGYLFCAEQNADKEAARQAEFATLLQERLEEQGRMWAELAGLASEKAAEFRADRDALRERNEELQARIEEAELTKPPERVVIERCERGEENETVIIGNPIGDDFVRLWNEASRADRHTRAEGTDSE